MSRPFARRDEPRTRVGHCCGKTCPHAGTGIDVPLYRVGLLFRYRCRDCYKAETGVYP